MFPSQLLRPHYILLYYTSLQKEEGGAEQKSGGRIGNGNWKCTYFFAFLLRPFVRSVRLSLLLTSIMQLYYGGNGKKILNDEEEEK